MKLECVEYQGTRYAEVVRAGVRVDKTQFFSPPESSFQFGLLAHKAGFSEPPHYHKPFPREVSDLQQMFVMQRGRVVVELNRDIVSREAHGSTLLKEGDALEIVHFVGGG